MKTVDVSNNPVARRLTFTTALAVGAAIGAIVLVGLDRYSWGAANPPLTVMGAQGSTGHYWQVLVAFASVALLATVSLLAIRRSRLALRVGWIESVVFLAFNAALIGRDGAARWVQQGFGSSSVEFLLLLGGVLFRVGLLAALRARQSGHSQ